MPAFRNNSKKFLQRYIDFAIYFTNVLLIFLFLNIVSSFIIFALDRLPSLKPSDPVSQKHHDQVYHAYPSLSAATVQKLLAETWQNPLVPEAFIGFKERPRHGQFVNVTSHGFRSAKPLPPWPPDSTDINIFIFGGSTTFGYGVPDQETIAVYLHDYLAQQSPQKIRVYNFGRGYYFSTTERILFENLLLRGIKPTLAIFVDGLNEFYSYDDNQIIGVQYSAMKSFLPQPAPSWFNRLPLLQLILQFKKVLPVKDPNTIRQTGEPEPNLAQIFQDRSVLDYVIQRYIENKKMIEAVAQSYQIKTVFVWQPIPLYKYNSRFHPFTISPDHVLNYAKYGYAEMAKLPRSKIFGDDFLWTADLQENINEPLYVDSFHYSPKLNKMLAQSIGDFLLNNGIFPK